MTNISLKFAGTVTAKESYDTVKRRLMDSNSFFEVKVNGERKLFAKTEVQGVSKSPKPKRAIRR